MEIATLIAAIGPFLPSLLKPTDLSINRPTESAADQTARAIWEILGSKIAAKATAQEAAIDLAHNPGDQDLQATLRVQLKKLLDQDPELSAEIKRILHADATDRPTGTKIEQNVKGDQNQVIGQVSGGHVFGNIMGNVVISQPVSPAISIPAIDPTSEQSRSVKTILLLAANPKGTNPVRLGEEVREIQIGLDRSQHRDHFRIEQRWAVTPKDVRRALLDCQPQIVHFPVMALALRLPAIRIRQPENSPSR
jgi:hypothetical protein